METLNYLVVDKDGQRRRGKIEALDPHKAATLLRERGNLVIQLKSTKASKLPSLTFLQKVSDIDRTNFTRLLATMIGTGLPITIALQNLADEMENPKMKTVIENVLRDVQGGSSLSRAMERFPDVFSSVYINLIRTGEESGNLDQTLKRLAENMEKDREFKGKLRSAMIYPVIVLVAMLGVAALMMILVVPKIAVVYEEAQADLPLPTQMLITFSKMITGGWWAGLILLGVTVFLTKTFKKTAQGEEFFNELGFNTPVFGKLNRQVVLTRLTRTLGVLIGSGVAILDALRLTAETLGENSYRDQLVEAANSVEQGFALSAALKAHEKLPAIIPQMVAVGEDTGTLDEILNKLATFFETETEFAIKNLTAAIEPLIIIVLGVGVTGLAAAIILPLFNLVNVIR